MTVVWPVSRSSAMSTSPIPALGRGSRVLAALLVGTIVCAFAEGYLQNLPGGLSKSVAGIFMVLWGVRLIYLRRLPAMHPVSWLTVALAGIVALSAATNQHDSHVVLYVSRWVPFLTLTIVICAVLIDSIPVEVAAYAFIAGALAAAVGALYSFFVMHRARAVGPLPDPNDLGYVLASTIPLVLLAFPTGRGLGMRVARTTASLVLVLAVATTFSRGAAVGLAAFALWAAARRVFRLRSVAIALTSAACALALAWGLAPITADNALHQKEYVAQANIDSRELRWSAAARLLAEHPLVGVGPGGFQDNYVRSHDAELISIDPPPVTHNMYLEVGSELGAPGLLVFVAIIGTGFVSSELARRRGPQGLALGVQGSLVVISVASLFLSEEYYLPLWAVIAMACALSTPRRRVV